MLIQNGYRDQSMGLRYFGAGILINGAYPFVSQNTTGARRNLWAGEADINLKSSVPAGARHPVSWNMAPQAGGLSSRNETNITVTPTGFAALGVPIYGSCDIVFSSSAFAGLLLFGSGFATIDLSASATIDSLTFALMQGEASISFSQSGDIYGARYGQGSATIEITTTALIGAEAGIAASATIGLSGTGTILATGFMSGLSTSETEFSATALANAVWQASAASYAGSGTMGEKVNDAGSASNPWTEVIESGLTAAEILKLISSVLYGKTVITDNSDGTATVIFRDLGDTKDRLTVEIDGSERVSITTDED